MAYPLSPYIEERNGGLYVAGTRVSLDSVVIRFQQGASTEKIVQSFPALQLSHVYGAIAYYLNPAHSPSRNVGQEANWRPSEAILVS